MEIYKIGPFAAIFPQNLANTHTHTQISVLAKNSNMDPSKIKNFVPSI